MKGEIKNIKHQTSSIVFKLLNDLKSEYKIENFSGNFDGRKKVIEAIEAKNGSKHTIDVIYEKFIRLTILEPELKTHIVNTFHGHSSQDTKMTDNQNDNSIYKIQLPTIVNNLDTRNASFLERDNVIDKMCKLLESHKCI